MSPVSRGRKPKKSKKSGSTKQRRPQPSSTPASPAATTFDPASPVAGPRQSPKWFGPATEAVLERAGHDLPQANGPRELEQATAELLGAQLHHAVHEEREGLWLSRWAAELAEGAATRCREALHSDSEDWQVPWLLLHGMSSIAPPELHDAVRAALGRIKPGARRKQRNWLWRLPKSTATGDVWRMRDAYGTRFAVLAGFSYPGRVDPSVFLFGIDASGFVLLEFAGVYDDAEQAATAWRDWVGESAAHAEAHAVDDVEQLLCLAHSDIGDSIMFGSETRNVLDNFYRAERRLHDLDDALRKHGMPLPSTGSLYHDIDPSPMKEEFTRWYTAEHGQAPHADALDDLAAEWQEGTLHETWYRVSPGRLHHLLALISDWPQDEITEAVLHLLPEWARWLGERAGLTEPLMQHVLEAARNTPHAAAQRV